MKKYLKYALLILTVLCALILGGCVPSYEVDVIYEDATHFMDDKMVDILIPISENDINYVERSSYSSNSEIADDSEILQYSDEKGYMSAYYHTGIISEFYSSEQKSTFDFERERLFFDFCDTYGTFRLAVIDKQGRIFSVSEEIPFKSSENYYLSDEIKFNPVTNEISQRYRSKNGESPFKLAALMFAWIMPIFSIILFLVFFLPKDVPAAKNPVTLIGFGVTIIPLALYLVQRFYESSKASISDKMALEIFFDFGVSWICVPYLLLPYIAFIAAAFVIYYRRKNDETTQNDIPMIDMK